jgi:hypothetical protein
MIKDGETMRLTHVSPEVNLASIRDRGLVAQKGERAAALGESDTAVYAFPNFGCADAALGSWLGDEFDDPERGNELILVEFDVPRHQTYSITPWEVICTESIPPESIVAFYDEENVRINVAPRCVDEASLLQEIESKAPSP